MEKKPVSKLRPPSRIPPLVPKTVPNAAGPSKSRVEPGKPLPRRMHVRRSKSLIEFPVSRVLKPLIVKKNTPIEINRPTVKPETAVAGTRKRPNVEKSSLETKPKITKPMKPAPYDYKARFNLLLEKHKLEVDTNKECKSEREGALRENEVYKAENSRLQAELRLRSEACKKVEAQFEACRTRCAALETEKAAVLNLNTELSIELHKLKEECDSVTAALKNLCNTHEEVTKEAQAANSQLLDTHRRIGEQDELLHRYVDELKKNEDLRRILHNNLQDLKGNIRVYCRMRPALVAEADKQLVNVDISDECCIELRKSRESISASGRPADSKQEFKFDKVFAPDSTQELVFEDLSQLVQSALDGYNVCVFAYGQTGSGKTYTMEGTSHKSGMIPKCVDFLFHKIEILKLAGWTYEVQACFLEIYNEAIRDLLDYNNIQSHEIRNNEGRGVTITHMRVEEVKSAQKLKDLMHAAQRNRAVASTNFNEHSSRSHSVMKLTLEGRHRQSETVYQSSIHLVDLAGSESAKTSDRLTETKNINKSLSALGNVMLALHNKDPHVPYRNSKLTHLLQACLGGNSKTLMFVNVSPLEECFGETINSLRFAAKVKEVRVVAKVNRVHRM